MTEQPGQADRGSSEENSGAPFTEAEAETLNRPAGVTPGVTPGFEDADTGSADGADGADSGIVPDTADDQDAPHDGGDFERRKELNPDDFE